VVLLKPFGPLQVYINPPGVAEEEVRLSVLPVQSGPLLPITGVAGGLGSLSDTGPFVIDKQPPPTLTRILS
jgi:hypothetical protein